MAFVDDVVVLDVCWEEEFLMGFKMEKKAEQELKPRVCVVCPGDYGVDLGLIIESHSRDMLTLTEERVYDEIPSGYDTYLLHISNIGKGALRKLRTSNRSSTIIGFGGCVRCSEDIPEEFLECADRNYLSKDLINKIIDEKTF